MNIIFGILRNVKFTSGLKNNLRKQKRLNWAMNK